MFRFLFERSPDAICLYDARNGVFKDCNQAAVELMRCSSRERILQTSPAELSPPFQPDGRSSAEKLVELAALAEQNGSVRFEWVARRFDGTEVPLEIVATVLPLSEQTLHVITSRDISERKKAEREIRNLNSTLERRVLDRTAELTASEARLRTIVEHAPEAIVVFDAKINRFVMVNENAVRLFGLSREALLQTGPAEVSPPVQPDGRPSAAAARELIGRALEGETPTFEWMHRHATGRLIPCEIRLVRLPSDGCLVRGSITDNTERKRKEKIHQAIFQISEAVHTADDLKDLYERIHSIIKELMPAQNFYIALFNPATQLLNFAYFVDEKDPKPGPLKLTSGLTGYVLRTGKALLAHDRNTRRNGQGGTAIVLEDGQATPYFEQGTSAAIWLGVPLIIQGKSVGAMAVQDYENPEAYCEEDKQILAFVAGQIALAIERKRGEQELRRRSEQAQRHRDALLELLRADKPDFVTALRNICSVGAATLDLARVSYWSLQENDSLLACEFVYGRGPQPGDESRPKSFPISKCPVCLDALTKKRPVVAGPNDLLGASSETDKQHPSLMFPPRIIVPVWVRGCVVGVLACEHGGASREWTVEEMDFASSLANMVSLAVEESCRRQSEEHLRESEEKFRALFEASSQGVMLHDEEKFIEVNPAALRILGFNTAEEIVGKHPAQTSSPVQPNGQSAEQLARKYIEQCMTEGAARFEWVARNPKGQDVPLEVILTRIPTRGRHIIQAVINDISERKRAEDELLKALAREKELGQLKSNFVSMVSHEFRTPLGVILSSAEILDFYFDQLEPGERREQLESIQKNARRMASLMEEVLWLGMVEAGKMDFKPTPLHLENFCRRVIDEVLSATDQKCAIRLQTASMPQEAQADERLLHHIFTNLLSNAVKYSPPGQTVDLELEQRGTEAICRFRDHGVGIPEGDLDRLFNAFFRGRNVGVTAGTGLGLTIVKRCLELHNGKIQVESKLGEGTIMTVRLPIFPGAPDRALRHESSSLEPRAPTGAPRLK